MIAGIWDCLSSQDVVNIVRYQIFKGKELTEIGGMICDFCLAPDTDSGVIGIGCDNMTVLIVAITHGRSKKQWYTWIKDRVKKKYGHETPSALPYLYSESRRKAFREREINHLRQEKNKASTSSKLPPSSTQAHSRNDSSEGSSIFGSPISWISYFFPIFSFSFCCRLGWCCQWSILAYTVIIFYNHVHTLTPLL